jgi:hypothetical protein
MKRSQCNAVHYILNAKKTEHSDYQISLRLLIYGIQCECMHWIQLARLVDPSEHGNERSGSLG